MRLKKTKQKKIIYVVTDGAYSDYHIEAVFTSKENAEKFASLHDCAIEEWDAGAYQIDGDVDVWYQYEFDAGWHFDLCKTRYSEKKVEYVIGDCVVVSLKERDEKKARKIAQDLYAQRKWEQAENDGDIK